MPPKRRTAKAASSSIRDDEAVARFIERFGGAMVEAGMPRMPARVFAALLSSDDGARTAAELAQQMQVSPAAISGAVRYLMQVGMVTRDREPGSRRDVYRLYSDTWFEVLANRDQQYARWIDSLRNGIDAVGASTPAGRRLDETMRFFDFVRVETPLLMKRWREQQARARTRG